MTLYIVRRSLQNIMFVMLSGLLLYTTLVMLMPGSNTPATRYNALKGQLQDPAPVESYVVPVQIQFQELEQQYKLDKPWPLNFLTWLFDPSVTETEGYDLSGNLVRTPKGIDVTILGLQIRGSGVITGDFGRGERYAARAPISEIIEDRWFNTLILLMTSFGLILLVGIPLGIFGALRQRSAMDYVFTTFTIGGLSIPPFLLGLLLIILFAILPSALHNQNGWTWLPWLPAGGVGDRSDFWDGVSHLVLPSITLAIAQIAWLSRYTRFAMLDVLRQDYIRTAWAKGLSARRVVFKHALRNTLIPLITQFALLLPTLTSTAVVVETVFAYEGMGRAFFSAMGGCLVSSTMLLSQDPRPCPWSGYWPIDTQFALVLLLILVVVVAVSNLLADVLYVVADPRISYASDARSS